MLASDIRDLQTDALAFAPRVLETAVHEERRLTIAIAVSQLAADAVQPEIAHLASAAVPTSHQKGLVIAARGAITRREQDAVCSLETMGHSALAEAAQTQDIKSIRADRLSSIICYTSTEVVIPAFEIFSGSQVFARAVLLIAQRQRYAHPHDLADTAPLLVQHAPDITHAYDWMAEHNMPVQFLKPREQVALFAQTGDTKFLNLATATAKRDISYERSYHPIVLERVMQATRPVYVALLEAGYANHAEELAAHVATHVESMYSTGGTPSSDAAKRRRGERFYEQLTEEPAMTQKELEPTQKEDIRPVGDIMTMKNPIGREHLLAKTYKQLGDVMAEAHAHEPTIPVVLKRSPQQITAKSQKRRFAFFGRK